MTAVFSAGISEARLRDAELLDLLRRRDEATFVRLVDAWSPTLLGLAKAIVQQPEVAEEIVQDAWTALLDGLDTFEGRASLKTWLCQIVVNRARTRAVRDQRVQPSARDDDVEAAFFDSSGDWLNPVKPWQLPADAQLDRERMRHALAEAIAQLPENQRVVVTLRDVEGLSSEETCHVLGLSETNQRQLLHRGRARLRVSLAKLWEMP